MSAIDTQRLLMEMRAVAQQAQLSSVGNNNQVPSVNDIGAAGSVGATDATSGPSTDFASLMRQAVDKVNTMQTTSDQSKQEFELGTPGVELSDVMIQAQKASLAFQAMSQVRSKLVEAYKDVMNMPI
jgi:flagellar hook-basal body complex protein FliE